MIRSFSHKGLERSYETGITRGIPSQQTNRIRIVLGRLQASMSPQDMNLPGLNLHELRGRRRGTWFVRLTGNWRITFRFPEQDAEDVNLEDYH